MPTPFKKDLFILFERQSYREEKTEGERKTGKVERERRREKEKEGESKEETERGGESSSC